MLNFIMQNLSKIDKQLIIHYFYNSLFSSKYSQFKKLTEN